MPWMEANVYVVSGILLKWTCGTNNRKVIATEIVVMIQKLNVVEGWNNQVLVITVLMSTKIPAKAIPLKPR